MAYWVVYLMKVYNITLALIVNSDQTNIHLIPTTKERTWESKGSKHVQVLGVENKRQITKVIFLATNGFLLPLQIVLIKTIHHYLPPSNEGKKKCMNLGWDFTFNENHWSTLEIMKQSYCHTYIQIYDLRRIVGKLEDDVVVGLCIKAMIF
jgi:hypothetical protein